MYVLQSNIDKTFKYLLYSRALRSIALIYTSLAFSLYLSALHLSLVGIGIVAALVMLFTILLTFAYGAIGDRKGFKTEMVISEVVTFLGVAIIAVAIYIPLIVLGMALAGLSGSAGGMRGSFSPGSSAFIANNYRNEKERVKRYSSISLVASIAAIGGSILFSLVSMTSRFVGLLAAYRCFFAIAAFLLGLSIVFLLMLKEVPKEKKTTKILTQKSWHYLSKVIVVNILGGAGMGLIAPLLPLWLKLMYGATNFEIGTLFTAVYFFTAFGLYLSMKYASKFESLSIAAMTRIVGAIFVFAMALSPTFILAALFYLIRSIMGGFGNPSRTNVNIRGISNEDYGTASSVQGIATRVAQLSAGASGYLMDIALPLPLLIGGLFQFASGIGYKVLFNKRAK